MNVLWHAAASLIQFYTSSILQPHRQMLFLSASACIRHHEAQLALVPSRDLKLVTRSQLVATVTSIYEQYKSPSFHADRL